MPTPFVSFIGSGNLASHLAPALDNAGFVVKEIYSRNPTHAGALTGQLYQAEVKASLDFSTSPSSIFIIAASDDAIQEIAQEIILPDDAILVHTSGSQPLDILRYSASTRIGVLYPLQTFTKSRKSDISKIPFFVESGDDETGDILVEIASALSKSVYRIDSAERKALHVAAVFASNFTNHMLTIAQDILRTNNLDGSLVSPLIAETISKALSIGPEQSQTGPAMRGDLKILDIHLEFLQGNNSAAEIYKLISQDIVDRYSE